jgi:chromosome partitioning protein
MQIVFDPVIRCWVIVVDNKKGGPGKTTVCFNLSTLLAILFGWKILLIDLDTDRCLTDGICGGGFESKILHKQNILDVLVDPRSGFHNAKIPYDLAPFQPLVPKLVKLLPTRLETRTGGKIDFIAGSEDLAEAPEQFRDFPTTQPVVRFEQALPWVLRQPAVTDYYDAVFIDIGPGWDPVTRSGLFAGNYAIVPVKPASLDIEALKRHQMRITRANQERARADLAAWQTEVMGVVISQVDQRSEAQQKIAANLRTGLSRAQIPCFTTEIPVSDAILLAMQEHVPAWAAYPDDPATQQFVHLAVEIVQRVADGKAK